MRSLAASGVLLCASLCLSASAGHGNDRTASVHLLSSRSSSSSSSQHAGSPQRSIVNNAASSASSSASYSPSDANALISSFLRIEEYEVLRDGLQVPEQLTMQPFEQEHQDIAEPLMVLAEDMTSYGIDALLPSLQAEDGTLAKRLIHRFKVESTPGPRAWMELLETYRDRLAEKFGLTLKDEGASLKQDKRMMIPPVPGSLGGDMALGPELVDPVYVSYVKSLQSLAALQDDEVDPAHVPIIQLKGLRDIALKFGLQSEELKKAQEMLSITAESVLASYPGKILVVSLPVNLHHAGHKHGKHLRSESSSSIPFSTRSIKHSYHKRASSSQDNEAGPRPLVPTSGQCFESEDTCSNSTSSCYGHGDCVQGRKAGTQAQDSECWVCQCSNTKDDDGKTRYWSGPMCQKEDVSSPFFLLVGASFMLILVSAASVVLLAKVGSEALPSTLAALGGAPGHRKHD